MLEAELRFVGLGFVRGHFSEFNGCGSSHCIMNPSVLADILFWTNVESFVGWGIVLGAATGAAGYGAGKGLFAIQEWWAGPSDFGGLEAPEQPP